MRKTQETISKTRLRHLASFGSAVPYSFGFLYSSEKPLSSVTLSHAFSTSLIC